MNERDFLARRREKWDQLAALVAKADQRAGIRAFTREELLAFGPLYRRVSSDLAYARSHAITPDLVAYLNGLVGRAHALLYTTRSVERVGRSMLRFYMVEFPSLLQRHVRYFLACVALAILGTAFGYWLVMQHPDRLGVFIPEGLRSSAEAWKSGKVSDEARAEMSGLLMTHNLTVGLVAAASGVGGGVLALLDMFATGGMMGAMAALMTQYHRHATFWPGIVPHGIAELTAIFICGAAGLLMGGALLAPAPYRRADAFRLAGRDAVRLVLGTVPLFVFAGLIEGMFSHLPLPPAFRYAFAAINGVIWYIYLFAPRGDARPAADAARNLPAIQSVEA